MPAQTAEQLPIEERLAPGRRPDVERELTEKYHVKWSFVEEAKVGQFDLDKSLHNQARFEPIDEKTVELYADAMRRGEAFPGVIAYRPAPRARYVIIDGNHRLSAATRAEVPIDLYEIDRDTDPRTIALMTFSFNTKHGRPTSEEERISQAMYLVDNGASIDTAAASVSIPSRILKRALARHKADQRADEVGIKRNEWDSLSQTVRSRLLNVSTDEGFRDATALAYAAKLDANEVFDLVQELNASKSGTKQMAIVKARKSLLLERIQGAGGGVMGTGNRRGMGPKQRIGMAITSTLALPDDDKAILKMYAEPERKDAAEQMRQAGERLLRLSGLLLDKKK